MASAPERRRVVTVSAMLAAAIAMPIALAPATAGAQTLGVPQLDPPALDAPRAGVLHASAEWTEFPARAGSPDATADSDDHDPDEVHWRQEWTRFRWWQYVLSGTLFVTTMVIETEAVVRLRDQEDWSGGVLFDDWVRDVLVAPTPTTRTAAARVSDVFFHLNMSYPVLIDPLVALLIHESPDVAWQILMTGFQARVTAGFLTRLAHLAVGRDRPFKEKCLSGEYTDPLCEGDGHYNSFFSGHTSLVFASAGAVCAIHENIPLYGGGTLDDAACVGTLVSATGTAIFRLVSDRHWATDVLLGAGVGFAAGYLMPTYFNFTEADGTQLGVAPQAMGDFDGAGLTVFGTM